MPKDIVQVILNDLRYHYANAGDFDLDEGELRVTSGGDTHILLGLFPDEGGVPTKEYRITAEEI